MSLIDNAGKALRTNRIIIVDEYKIRKEYSTWYVSSLWADMEWKLNQNAK